MDEAEQLSTLIADIYDAALDRGLWPRILERTGAFVEGVASTLVVQDPIANSGHFYFSWGLSPEAEAIYLDKYVRLNPAILGTIVTAKVGDVVSTTTVVSYDEFLASRFYREWAQPRDYCDAVWTVLEKSATAAAAVSVLRSHRQGLADEGARQRMALVGPHFRRSVAISRIIDLHKVEAASLADALDGLAASMVLVNAAGRVMHANAAAMTMLDEGSVIRGAGGKLTALDPRADSILHNVFINAGGGDTAIGSRGIAVPLSRRDGERYVAHVLPLTSGARRKAGVAYSAVAAVFVHKAALDLPHPVEALAGAFKLTPAEMRVLMMIVQIGGVPDVAPVLGISETTVKTHLQSIFAKTGASRQADLVKLVAGYMSPLVG